MSPPAPWTWWSSVSSPRRCAKSSLTIWWRAIAASCGCELTASALPRDLDMGSLALRAIDAQSSTDGRHSLAHDAEAQVAGGDRLRMEAAPIVAYLQRDTPGGCIG